MPKTCLFRFKSTFLSKLQTGDSDGQPETILSESTELSHDHREHDDQLFSVRGDLIDCAIACAALGMVLSIAVIAWAHAEMHGSNTWLLAAVAVLISLVLAGVTAAWWSFKRRLDLGVAGGSLLPATDSIGDLATAEESTLVLIVEDEVRLRRLLRIQLELAGYRVDEAASGPEMIKRLSDSPSPSVILLDLGLPGMSGLDCLAHILQVNSRARVVVHSGLDLAGMREEAEELGAVDFISKPARPEFLVQAIDRAARDGRRSLIPANR